MRSSVVPFAAVLLSAVVVPTASRADDSGEWQAIVTRATEERTQPVRPEDRIAPGVFLIALGAGIWAGNVAAITQTVSSRVCHRDYQPVGSWAAWGSGLDSLGCGFEVFGEINLGLAATAAITGGVTLTVLGARRSRVAPTKPTVSIQLDARPDGVVLRGAF